MSWKKEFTHFGKNNNKPNYKMKIERMRSEELAAFNKFKDEFEIVFDVGARGNTEFIEIHPYCEYHLFEPQKIYADYLKDATKSYPNVKVNNFGLGDVPIKGAKFYRNVESFQPHPFINSEHTEGDEFDISTISEYCSTNNIQNIDFLKIDTEGYDYKVLLGAKDLLNQNKIKHIQFEYWSGVRPFYNMLTTKYNMWLMHENQTILELNESLVYHIDNERIPRGLGGDIFCKLKT
jgi:FkbM family methyltransferase